jgi:uncharacterized membrane protein
MKLQLFIQNLLHKYSSSDIKMYLGVFALGVMLLILLLAFFFNSYYLVYVFLLSWFFLLLLMGKFVYSCLYMAGFSSWIASVIFLLASSQNLLVRVFVLLLGLVLLVFFVILGEKVKRKRQKEMVPDLLNKLSE